MVRRRVGERFHPDCVVSTVKFGGGSIPKTVSPLKYSTLIYEPLKYYKVI